MFNLLNRFITKFRSSLFGSTNRTTSINCSKDFVSKLNVLFPDVSLTILDIGARFGIEKSDLNAIAYWNNLKLIGIEPDEDAALEIESKVDGVRYTKVYREAVWSKSGTAELNITNYHGCSSLLEPDDIGLASYTIAPLFKLKRKVTISTCKLDELLDVTEQPHIIKIDVQGGEGFVIQGGERTVANSLAVFTEAHIRPLYIGGESFTQLHEKYFANGWRLIGLSDANSFDGDIVEFNCVYVKDPAQINNKSDFIRLLIVAAAINNISYIDYLLRNYGQKWVCDDRERIYTFLKIVPKKVAKIPPTATGAEYSFSG